MNSEMSNENEGNEPKYISLAELVKRLKPIEEMTPEEKAEFLMADVEAQKQLEEMVRKAREEGKVISHDDPLANIIEQADATRQKKKRRKR